MAGIDESLPLHPLRIAVLTVSDTRDEGSDKSGALLIERLTGAGHELAGKVIVADDVEAIRDQVRAWAAAGRSKASSQTAGPASRRGAVRPRALTRCSR